MKSPDCATCEKVQTLSSLSQLWPDGHHAHARSLSGYDLCQVFILVVHSYIG